MSLGAGLVLPITQTTVLVEPGCFVHSIRHVGPLFLQMGPIAFANHHFRHTLEGILSPKEGASKIIQQIINFFELFFSANGRPSIVALTALVFPSLITN